MVSWECTKSRKVWADLQWQHRRAPPCQVRYDEAGRISLWESMPLLSLAEASRKRELLRNRQHRLVFTNGHFELLHLGHLRYLEAARSLGEALFVGVNGDQSTLRLKGRRSVIVPAAERAALVAALKPVTAVVIFEEDTARSIIEVLRPDLYVKGGDYSSQTAATPPKQLPERATVEAYGGRVIFVDYLANHSTSARIAQIQSLHRVCE